MASTRKYQTKSGTRYAARFRTPGDRKQTEKKGFKRKSDALAYGEDIESAKRSGDYIHAAHGKATIGELGPKLLQAKQVRKPSTVRPLEVSWKTHVLPRWGEVRVQDITHTDVKTWVAELASGDAGTGRCGAERAPRRRGGSRPCSARRRSGRPGSRRRSSPRIHASPATRAP